MCPSLLLIFAFIHWLPLALLVLVGLGMTSIWIENLLSVLVQLLVPQGLQGRAMSANIMIMFGFVPLGALWMGTAASY